MDILRKLFTITVLLFGSYKHGISGSDIPKDFFGSPLVLDSALENMDQYIDMYTLPKTRITLTGNPKEVQSSLKQIEPSGWCNIYDLGNHLVLYNFTSNKLMTCIF